MDLNAEANTFSWCGGNLMCPVTSDNGGEVTSGELQVACLPTDGQSYVAKSVNAATRLQNVFLPHMFICESL